MILLSAALFCLIINPLLIVSQSDSLQYEGRVQGMRNRPKRRLEENTEIGILGKGKGSPKPGKGKGKGSSKVGFDLSDCSSYALEWIVELQSTCNQPIDENFSGCQCADAESRIAAGEINCGFDLCPQDCEVCKVCLYYAIDNCLMGTPPKISPGFLNPPSRIDNKSPTPAPSPPPPPPTNPDDPFDQMTCATYSSVWSMDLVESCAGNVFNNDFTGCQCPDAERRIANGQINCKADRPCPDSCTPCELCLYYVVDDCLG